MRSSVVTGRQSRPRSGLLPRPVARADSDLLRDLSAAHAAPLLAYALRLTGGDRQWAEDVVQETMLRAWRHPEALSPETGSTRGWLLTVSRNLVRDQQRSRRSRPVEVGEATVDLERLTADQADPIDRAVRAWTVAEALRGLRPEHRAVLLETYYRGRSVAEAAVELGIPPGTVKSRTFYALKALRLALTEHGVLG